MRQIETNIQRIAAQPLKWISLSVLIGVFAGLSSTFFLYALNLATHTFQIHPNLVYGLPLAGALTVWSYQRFCNPSTAGSTLILDEIHNPKKILPVAMAPLVFCATLLTHLFGGSAGREGTAIQIGSSLADLLSKPFRIAHEDRKILLMAGASAGFSAVIGTPLAGAIFGMEMLYVRGIKFFALGECLIASFVGYFVSRYLKAPHSEFLAIAIPTFSVQTIGSVLFAAIAFAVAAVAFIKMSHGMEYVLKKARLQSYFKPIVGATVLICIYKALGTNRFAGLGIDSIQQALNIPASPFDPLIKAICTALTLASGFKGGEFVPLVFIGTTLGSALSLALPAAPGFLGALGFAAVFGAASNTPLASTLMAIELFGWPIAPYALATCLIAYYCSGQHTIYRGQRKFAR